jgi:hypothetical protein
MEDWEDDIRDELKRQLDAEPMKLLSQAESIEPALSPRRE